MIWLVLLACLVWLVWVLSTVDLIRVFNVRKDGGPDSYVQGYWLFECKFLFSVVLLKFAPGWREVYHSHAFDAVSWVLGPGRLREEHLLGYKERHPRSFKPVFTWRTTFHRVFSEGTTWVLSFRGPWANRWFEYDDQSRRLTELAHGRVVVATHDDTEPVQALVVA